jgi:hopanoid biosynthesis associated protein HpnK
VTRPAAARLIVNADDLGLHPGINAGVVRAHREGIVTAASLSPNGAALDDAVRLLRSAPTLDVGVHLTLVGETPLMPPGRIPTLAPRGRLPGYFTTLFRRLLLGSIRLAEVELELEAQLARVRDAGLRPTHVDSHQHVHLHPTLLPLVLGLARRFGVRAVRAAPRVYPLRAVRPALLSVFARGAARQVRRSGLATADVLLGAAETGRLDEARLLRLVERLPRGTSELVCHPGIGDEDIGRRYEWGFGWDSELRGLTSPRVRAALETRGVRLIGPSAL